MSAFPLIDAVHGHGNRVRRPLSKRFQICVLRVSEETANGCPVWEAEEHQTVWLPITFNHFKITAANEVLSAMLGYKCWHTLAITLKAFLVVHV